MYCPPNYTEYGMQRKQSSSLHKLAKECVHIGSPY